MPIKETKAKVNNIETFYRHDGNGEPIVFLHGIPSSSFLWRDVMKELAPDFAVYAPDLPGFAQSANPEDLSPDTYSKWLNAFVDKNVGQDKINLVIHDMGGPISIKFVIDHQDKINKLIIMDTILTKKGLSFLMQMFITDFGIRVYYNLNEVSFKYLLRAYSVHNKGKLFGENLNNYYQAFLRDKKEKNTKKFLSSYINKTEKYVADKLSTINIPTLVLWAEKDKVIPLKTGQYIHSQIKGSDFQTLPNCGHFSQEEEPELIAGKIKEFLINS